MKLRYYPETDSLYIDLSEKTSTESVEISDDIVLDIDSDGKPVGIDIQNASCGVDLNNFEMHIPKAIKTERETA